MRPSTLSDIDVNTAIKRCSSCHCFLRLWSQTILTIFHFIVSAILNRIQVGNRRNCKNQPENSVGEKASQSILELLRLTTLTLKRSRFFFWGGGLNGPLIGFSNLKLEALK